MIDAHCHVRKNADRHFICGGEKEGSDVVFYGTHPWYVDEFDKEKLILNLVLALNMNSVVFKISMTIKLMKQLVQ